MQPEDLPGFLDFLREAGRLKKERRRGWVVKVKVTDAESVADHSWRTALMALILGGSRGLDTQRMTAMALIHDLSEAVTGDLTPEDEQDPRRKRELADEAFQRLLSLLPASMRSNLALLWQEYQQSTTEEAQLVRELDKVEMALQAEEYGREGYNKAALAEFLSHSERSVRDRELIQLLHVLRGAS